MEITSNNRCSACGGNFLVQYYQRRAADEPPDKVEFCPNCPLDSRRLSLTLSTNNNINLKSDKKISIPKRSSTVLPDTLYKSGSRTCILVEGAAANRCMQLAIKNNLSKDVVTSITVPVMRGSGKGLTDLYTKSIVEGEAHIISTSDIIAPFVSLQQIDVYKLKQINKPNYQEYTAGYEIRLPPINFAEYTFLRISGSSEKVKLYILLPEELEKSNDLSEEILFILEDILATYGTETSIKSFISPSIISSLYTQSAKAYDWPSAPETGYSYTWKPDGERFWYIKYGTVWLFSRRLLSGSISGWNIESSVKTVTKVGPILDVEVMIGHDPILIDVLVLESGISTPPTRSLRYVLDTYFSMENVGVPIYVRDYYNKESEVVKNKDSLTYPTDGIVGIQDGSMTIIKLKTTKSIELTLSENGDLLTIDEELVATSKLQDLYEPGSIIELRLTKERNNPEPRIDEIILRTDKTKANSYEVCKSILHTMSDMPDTLERRRALVWCNTVRNKLYQIAASQSERGRMILDIGAGDGQAVSDYSSDPDITYMLLEPDNRKCKSLIRRLQGKGTSRLFIGAEHFAHVVASLTTGNLRYGVIQATLADILKQEHCIKILRGSTRYCITSFSISYIKNDVRRLALSGLDIIGCGYFYDNMNYEGYLINECNVIMKQETKNESSVKWGSDKVYKEPIVYKRDFEDIFHVRNATELIPVFKSENVGLLNTISSNVYIISTRKYI